MIASWMSKSATNECARYKRQTEYRTKLGINRLKIFPNSKWERDRQQTNKKRKEKKKKTEKKEQPDVAERFQ